MKQRSKGHHSSHLLRAGVAGLQLHVAWRAYKAQQR